MRSKLLLLLPVIILAASFAGCNIINPSEATPTYVQIDSFSFKQTDPNKTGSISHKITAVWVYFDNDAIGVFELPCRFPIITDKRGVVSVSPGVTYGGIKDEHSQYPFYTFDSMTIDPAPGQVHVFDAETRYINDFTLAYVEDFEIGNGFERADVNKTEDTSLVRTAATGQVYEGAGSGYIYIDQSHPSSAVVNNTPFRVSSGRAFLEINYKCSVDFMIGLRGTFANDVQVEQDFHGIRPNGNWNKLYIDIEPYVASLGAARYQVRISTELPDGQQNGYVLIDNIKVVTF